VVFDGGFVEVGHGVGPVSGVEGKLRNAAG
jgi:hypothetical protein